MDAEDKERLIVVEKDTKFIKDFILSDYRDIRDTVKSHQNAIKILKWVSGIAIAAVTAVGAFLTTQK